MMFIYGFVAPPVLGILDSVHGDFCWISSSGGIH